MYKHRPEKPTPLSAYKKTANKPAKQKQQAPLKLNLNSVFITSIICIAILFVSSFSYVTLNSQVLEAQHQLKLTNKIWQESLSQLNKLTSILAQAYDLDIIEEKAVNELLMHKPLPHQIVYIDIKKESFTEYE
ncbi:hypothetical protein AN641_00610 [Candidatus Epulonipiscioides gigas]|nr:hypothetical protein AN641_00610 [Epulopiscium sp. SCG-C07WGA-EpuloA2]